MFTGNLLQRHSLQPWWEKFQNLIFKVYVAILIGYGFTFTDPTLHCLPVEKELLTEMNEAQFAFVNLYCANSYLNMSGLLLFLLYVFTLVSSQYVDTLLENNRLQICVTTFSNARQKILELDLPLDDLKKKAVAPIFGRTEDSSANPDTVVRKIVTNLGTCNYENPTDILIHRSKMTIALSMLILGCMLLLFIVDKIMNGLSSKTIECDVDEQSQFDWIGNITIFVCTPSPRTVDILITVIYYSLLILQICVSYFALLSLSKMKKETERFIGYGSKDFLKARNCMLCLARFSKGDDEQKLKFGDFVEFLFHKSTIPIFDRAIPSACGFYGNETDEELINLYSRMTGESRLEELAPTYDGKIPELIERKKWKSIVLLLNLLPGKFEEIHRIRDIISTPDDFGNNILFYALDRKPGSAEFKTRAAKYILPEIDPSHRIVIQDNQETSVNDFVQFQFDRDPTYPESLRKQLQRLTS